MSRAPLLRRAWFTYEKVFRVVTVGMRKHPTLADEIALFSLEGPTAKTEQELLRFVYRTLQDRLRAEWLQLYASLLRTWEQRLGVSPSTVDLAQVPLGALLRQPEFQQRRRSARVLSQQSADELEEQRSRAVERASRQ